MDLVELFTTIFPLIFSHISQILTEAGKKYPFIDKNASLVNFLLTIILVIIFSQIIGGDFMTYLVIALTGGAVSSGAHGRVKKINKTHKDQ